jgi:hypothetical protein
LSSFKVSAFETLPIAKSKASFLYVSSLSNSISKELFLYNAFLIDILNFTFTFLQYCSLKISLISSSSFSKRVSPLTNCVVSTPIASKKFANSQAIKPPPTIVIELVLFLLQLLF